MARQAAAATVSATTGLALGGLFAVPVVQFGRKTRLPELADEVPTPEDLPLRVVYEDGRGLLRTILIRCTELRFAINHVRLDREDGFIESGSGGHGR